MFVHSLEIHKTIQARPFVLLLTDCLSLSHVYDVISDNKKLLKATTINKRKKNATTTRVSQSSKYHEGESNRA